MTLAAGRTDETLRRVEPAHAEHDPLLPHAHPLVYPRGLAHEPRSASLTPGVWT